MLKTVLSWGAAKGRGALKHMGRIAVGILAIPVGLFAIGWGVLRIALVTAECFCWPMSIGRHATLNSRCSCKDMVCGTCYPSGIGHVLGVIAVLTGIITTIFWFVGKQFPPAQFISAWMVYGWLGLAVASVLNAIGGSVLDKQGRELQHRYRRWKSTREAKRYEAEAEERRREDARKALEAKAKAEAETKLRVEAKDRALQLLLDIIDTNPERIERHKLAERVRDFSSRLGELEGVADGNEMLRDRLASVRGRIEELCTENRIPIPSA